jgi:hypothetical protein
MTHDEWHLLLLIVLLVNLAATIGVLALLNKYRPTPTVTTTRP